MIKNTNYTLDIVSRHPNFESKALRKYNINGVETVGAWGDEPFEIRFKNNTWNKVQVKISVDGTDILTGDLASTEVSKEMWLVNPYGTLTLKAWPETNKGGAAFMFTSADNGVATHIHGDQSNRGIIAAAVYVEGHEPVRISNEGWFDSFRLADSRGDNTKGTASKGMRRSKQTLGGPSGQSAGGGTYTSGTLSFNNTTTTNSSFNEGVASNYFNHVSDDDSLTLGDLKELVAVGAGQQIEQTINYVPGLTKPVFSEIIKVKYMWWDELVAELKQQNPEPNPNGFPGDRKIVDLGNTPRLPAPKPKRPIRKRSSIFSRF